MSEAPDSSTIEWLKRVDLAILANRGETWRADMCSCDPSVGMSPCEYCAIHEALRYTKARIEAGRTKL